MYDMRNPMPAWTEKFFNVFEGTNVGLSFYKMNTCNILPQHRDIFLEDWLPGHIFEIERTPVTNWKAGEYVLWQYDAEHMAANLGLEPRYTLQVTYTDV